MGKVEETEVTGSPRFPFLLPSEARSGIETVELFLVTAGDHFSKSSSLVTELEEAERVGRPLPSLGGILLAVVARFVPEAEEVTRVEPWGEGDGGDAPGVDGSVLSDVLTANCAGLSLGGSFFSVPGILKYLRCGATNRSTMASLRRLKIISLILGKMRFLTCPAFSPMAISMTKSMVGSS